MINVSRPADAPPSLSQRKHWDRADTVARLHEVFRGKCYLCERPLALRDLTVDHRVPRSVCERRTYDWTNLYACCSDCNRRRRRTWPEGGLLFPADGDDAEARLSQVLEIACDPGDLVHCAFAAVEAADEQAAHTAGELDEIHNASRTRRPVSRMRAKDLRRAILRRAEKVAAACRAAWEDDSDDDLRRLVSRDAPYTMLLRSRVPPRLLELLDR